MSVERSRALHEALERHLDIRDGELLGAWLVIYETVRLDEEGAAVGHHYGPGVIPAWRALGLLEWQRRSFIAMVGRDDDEDEDELEDES